MKNGEKWELRNLPQPLYRYESTNPDVLDGSLFCFVTSAGTDPGLMLLIEARKEGGGYAWTWAGVRFSDLSLTLERNKEVAWSSIRDQDNTWDHDKLHLFRFYRDRIIDELVLVP